MEISATSCTSSDLSPMQQAENDLGQIATGSTMFSPMNLFSRENSVTAAPEEVRVSSVGTSARSVSARVGTRKGYPVGNRSGHSPFKSYKFGEASH